MKRKETELKELFVRGTEFDAAALVALLDQYKLLVETSENLVSRRQRVNTFFLSANAILLSIVGSVLSRSIDADINVASVLAVSLAGIILSVSWRRLVRSYRQLNRIKFDLIHAIENFLPASVFYAEWELLGKGENSRIYVPFTKTESAIPLIFVVVYSVSFLAGLVIGVNAYWFRLMTWIMCSY